MLGTRNFSWVYLACRITTEQNLVRKKKKQKSLKPQWLKWNRCCNYKDRQLATNKGSCCAPLLILILEVTFSRPHVESTSLSQLYFISHQLHCSRPCWNTVAGAGFEAREVHLTENTTSCASWICLRIGKTTSACMLSWNLVSAGKHSWDFVSNCYWVQVGASIANHSSRIFRVRYRSRHSLPCEYSKSTMCWGDCFLTFEAPNFLMSHHNVPLLTLPESLKKRSYRQSQRLYN